MNHNNQLDIVPRRRQDTTRARANPDELKICTGLVYWHRACTGDEEGAKPILMYCHARDDPLYFQFLGDAGESYSRTPLHGRQQRVGNATNQLQLSEYRQVLERPTNPQPAAAAPVNNNAQPSKHNNGNARHPPAQQPVLLANVPAGPGLVVQLKPQLTPAMGYGAVQQPCGAAPYPQAVMPSTYTMQAAQWPYNPFMLPYNGR